MTEKIVSKKKMETIWFDPSNPAGYTGIEKLRKASNYTKKDTTQWLRNQLSYSLNKPMRKRFPTRKYKTSGINTLWQMDLMEMIPYSTINKGYKYILTCIDVFSRFARALPIKTKSANDITIAISKMFKEAIPTNLQTDLGKEFYNSKVKSILSKQNINHYSVFSQFKASLVERFNRTLRERLKRYFVKQGNKKWVTVLPSIIHAYNNSKHRGINGLKPVEVTSRTAYNLWSSQNPKFIPEKAKYKIGDFVRISKISASPFIKNFDQNWSDEVFQIAKIDNKQNPIMYTIKDVDDEIVQGKFYELELQVIDKPNVFRVQEILKTKGKGENKQYYVKWHGYKKPSWIATKDLIST